MALKRIRDLNGIGIIKEVILRLKNINEVCFTCKKVHEGELNILWTPSS